MITGVKAVSASRYHSLFLKTDGTVWVTGNNELAKFGLPDASKPIPVKVLLPTVSVPTPWQLAHFGDEATSHGISYTPQFSSTLADENGWSPATGLETIQSIDATWERVTITDTFPAVPSGAPLKHFARVKVTTNP